MSSKRHQEDYDEEEEDDDDDGPPELVALPPNKPPPSSSAPAQDAQPLPSSSTGPSTIPSSSKIVPVTIITGFLGAGTCVI
jgi:hypothetical protein